MIKALLSIWSYRIVRIVLGGIFIWAGGIKMVDYRGFAELISWYELVPYSYSLYVAIIIIGLELLGGIGLVFDVRLSLETITALIVLFIIVLWFGILKGLEIDCGCFDLEEIKEQNSLRMAFYRDFVFLAMAFYLYWWRWMRAHKQQS